MNEITQLSIALALGLLVGGWLANTYLMQTHAYLEALTDAIKKAIDSLKK